MKRFYGAGEFKHLPVQALALSIVFHLAVSCLFVFTFSLLPVSPKPEFVFWGSILKQRDVAGAALNEESARAHVLPRGSSAAARSLPKFSYESPPMTAGPLKGWGVEKPPSSGGIESGAKVTLKPSFDEMIPGAGDMPERAPSLEDIGTEYDIMPYNPLRVHRDD